MKWYKHETYCPKCKKVVSSYESTYKRDKKEEDWYMKHHMDMVHGTAKDREYYKRFGS